MHWYALCCRVSPRTPHIYLQSINGTEIGWALGAMIYEANLLPLDDITPMPATTAPVSAAPTQSAAPTPPAGTTATSAPPPAPADTTAAPTGTTSSPTGAPAKAKKWWVGLTVILVVVGVLVLVLLALLLVGLIYCLCCKKSKSQSYKEMS